MKKALFCMFAAFACGGLFAQQPVVAVAPFDAISGINSTEANMITRVFFIQLGNTNKVRLVDRSIVERVLREHSFQAGDWSDQKKTAELGTALNADWIVRGEMEKFGSDILVTVQFYDIRTFRYMGGTYIRLANADEAYSKIDPLVDKLVQTIATSGGGTRPSTPPTTSGGGTHQPTPTTRPTYKIGDRGPCGGIIFYVYSGRYKECIELPDKVDRSEIDNYARAYRGGGFDNWRIPSESEIDIIYVNFKRRFSGGWYFFKAYRVNWGVRKQLIYVLNFNNGQKKSVGDINQRIIAVREF
ncbi:MAG: hypothetical protein LBK73_02185 [Treponema sp.]|nr:hypothetical protein [Treponema sp.]